MTLLNLFVSKTLEKRYTVRRLEGCKNYPKEGYGHFYWVLEMLQFFCP